MYNNYSTNFSIDTSIYGIVDNNTKFIKFGTWEKYSYNINDLYNKNTEKNLLGFNKTSVSKQIDINKINKYKSLMPKEFHNAIDYVYNKLKFISIDYFKQKLYIVFERLLKKINDIDMIYLPIVYTKDMIIGNAKVKSNLWLALEFMYYMKNINIIKPTEYNLHIKCKNILNNKLINFWYYYGRNIRFNVRNKNIYIVLFDDCSYSGSQLSDFIDDVKRLNNVYICLPFISKYADSILNKKINIIKNLNNNIINYIINEDQIFNNLFDNMNYKDLIINYDMIFYDKYLRRNTIFNFLGINDLHTPVYFEHKLADNLSIPQFFINDAPVLENGAIIFERNNQYKNLVSQLYDKYLNTKFLFITFDYNNALGEHKRDVELIKKLNEFYTIVSYNLLSTEKNKFLNLLKTLNNKLQNSYIARILDNNIITNNIILEYRNESSLKNYIKHYNNNNFDSKNILYLKSTNYQQYIYDNNKENLICLKLIFGCDIECSRFLQIEGANSNNLCIHKYYSNIIMGIRTFNKFNFNNVKFNFDNIKFNKINV